jgi:putative oxidoreductase
VENHVKYNAPETALFILRASIFILMIVWATLKVIRPASYGSADDNPGIFENFYGAAIGPGVVLVLGILQIMLLLAFVLGVYKAITYGAVALMNAASLLVSMPRILDPFGAQPNLLFLASVPILGASIALFLMRDQDQFLSLKKERVISPT